MKSLSMRERANILLGVTALIYTLVFLGQFWVYSPYYEALYWISQSALIGSIADWFAVTALFRKPLGIPWHTALIPRNKGRLITSLIHLVESKMLTRQRCHELLDRLDFVSLWERYLLSDSGRQGLQDLVSQGLNVAWRARTHREWALWGALKLRCFLGNRSLVPAFRHVLLDLCEHNRYEVMVIQIISLLQTRMRHPAVQEWLTRVVAEEIKSKKKNFISDFLISISEATNLINPRELAGSILVESYQMLEIWKQKDSQERIDWLRQWVEPIRHLDDNDEVCRALDGAWQRWIREQEWETIIENHVCPYIEELLDKGPLGTETPANLLVHVLVNVWSTHGQDPALRSRLEVNLHTIAAYVLDQGYDLIERIIRHVLEGLTEEHFVEFIERKVEDDLSWLRINGAFVGGGAGLLTWLFLTYIYQPFMNTVGYGL